jgi:uncharacterized protein
MSLSFHTATVPVFVQMLGALSGVLDKAAAHCTAKKIDPAVMVATRLIPDMFPLARQVQTAADFAKNTTARLAGAELPKFEDRETTLDELKARIAKTLDFVKSIDQASVDAAAGREITFPIGPSQQVTLPAETYLFNFAMPNFYFHMTMAYAILREAGVDVGKRDFIGSVPGLKLP